MKHRQASRAVWIVLVIAAMLTDTQMEALVDCARECGLFVLLEAFDESDLERIGALAAIKPEETAAPLLVGVNSRNLRTLAVDFARFAALAPRLPRGLPAVAESGIETTTQLREIAELGYSLALVGSALLQAGSPVEQLASFVATGREHVGGEPACS